MATYTSIYYGAPVNADIVNRHVSNVITPGIYKGLYVRSAGPNSRVLDIRNDETGERDTAEYAGGIDQQKYYGLAFTAEGVKIEETEPVYSQISVDESSDTERIDLVYLQYEYRKVIPSKNKPSYHIIKGEPAMLGGIPTVPAVFTKQEVAERTGKTIHAVTELDIRDCSYYFNKIRIPLAYVKVHAGAQYITDADIVNYPRIMNSDSLVDYISEALYGALGNFRTSGWDLVKTLGAMSVMVTPGRGLINGKACYSEENSIIPDLRPRVMLMASTEAAAAMSLDNQPPYATCLRINIKAAPNQTIPSTHIDPTSGNIVPTAFSVSGVWLEGETEVTGTRVYPIPEDITSAMTDGYDIYTDPLLSVDVDGLGFEDFITPIQESNATIMITNQPRAYIYAVSQVNNKVIFEANYDPKHILRAKANELLLGYVETDEDSTEEVYPYAASVSSDCRESFTSRLNGITREFQLSGRPVEDTEIVVLDGLMLEKDSPLRVGYTMDYESNTITLQENVPTPDGQTSGLTGTKGATLWVKYRRRG